MSSRLELSVVEFLKDPVEVPSAIVWTDAQSFDASDPSWWVGSREPCAFVVPHSTVSRAQFLVRPGTNGRFILRNLGSYGTHVDGLHLQGTDEVELKERSTIRAGAVYFSAVTRSDGPRSTRKMQFDLPGEPSGQSRWATTDEDSVNVWGAWGLVNEPKLEPQDPEFILPKRSSVTDPEIQRESFVGQDPTDPIMDRILAAAGLPTAQRARAAGVVTPEDIGKLLAAWVRGARSVQFVKREIKESHRLEATSTLDGSVNPLRKAIPAEEILGLLLGLEGPMYAQGGEAVKQWFADLVQHETALPEAVREAWVRFVEQLSPDKIADRAEASGIVGKISRAHRLAAQWEAYEEFFTNELSDAQLSFRRLFVPRFSEAYSDALGNTAAPKKGKRRN